LWGPKSRVFVFVEELRLQSQALALRIPQLLSRSVLGIETAKSTVENYRPKLRKPPSPSRRTVLEQHMRQTVAIDFSAAISLITTNGARINLWRWIHPITDLSSHLKWERSSSSQLSMGRTTPISGELYEFSGPTAITTGSTMSVERAAS
jgi:hypothetical protein